MSAPTLALLLALAPAEPPPREDNPNYRVAIAAWDDARWDDAARAFAAAYELDPRPEYVFAQARARRLGGDCAAAVPIFERFLALDPPASAQQDARRNIDECGGPTPAAVAPVAPRVVDTPTPAAAPRPVARDPLGHALLWPGLALLATGAGLLADAHVRRGRAGDLDEQRYRDELGPAPVMSRVGIALVSAGAALGIAGAVRFIVLGARARRPRRAVAFVLDGRGLGAAW